MLAASQCDAKNLCEIVLQPRFGVIEPAPYLNWAHVPFGEPGTHLGTCAARTRALAKAKTKAVVKAKAAKAPAQKKAPAKTAVAKASARKAVKAVKTVAPKKDMPRKTAKVPAIETPVVAKPVPAVSNGGSVKAAPQVEPRAPIAATIAKTIAKTTLLKTKGSAPKPADPPKPASAPQPHRAAPPAAAPPWRADLPPAAGFSLMVDGHFKNQFETLKGARDAASELQARFPVLRLEIYDAVKKARLPM